MTYKKNKDGYYRHREVYDGVKIDIRTKSENEIFEKLRQKKNEIDNNTRVGSENMTVSAWCDIWLKTYKEPYVIKKSYDTYRYIINNQILPYIGTLRIRDVKPVRLQMIIKERIGKSSSHIKRVAITIKSIFKQARINGYITTDSSENLMLPVMENKSHRCITEEEKKILFKVCETHQHGLYAKTLYYCGLRPQEAIALRWKDVDIEGAILHISQAIESGTKKIKTTKTKSGVRDIPIPEELLILYKNNYKNSNDLIFPNDDKTQANNSSFNRWWKSLRRAMNIEMGAKIYRNKIIDDLLAPDFTAYCLRHTYCTNLQRAGVPLNVAKYLMGHSDVKITANIYGHQTDDQTEQARGMINDFHNKNGE